jgi:hypothetical protein
MSSDEASSQQKSDNSAVSYEQDVKVARTDEKTFTVQFSVRGLLLGAY